VLVHGDVCRVDLSPDLRFVVVSMCNINIFRFLFPHMCTDMIVCVHVCVCSGGGGAGGGGFVCVGGWVYMGGFVRLGK